MFEGCEIHTPRGVYVMEKRKIKDWELFERLMMEADEAKNRLDRIADRLEEAGFTRKANSARTLTYPCLTN